MECNVHHFDPQYAWGKEFPERNEYELTVQCLHCGRMFHFTEPLDRVKAFLYHRRLMRERFKGFDIRFGGM